MGERNLSREDAAQLEGHGLSAEEAQRQLELFRHPPPFMRLDRACTLRDGIVRLTPDQLAVGRRCYETAREQGRLAKFVPASGAASRMFHALAVVYHRCAAIERAEVERLVQEGDDAAREVLSFMKGFERFAFHPDLTAAMAADGLDATTLAARGQFREILRYLITSTGLNYAALPKGAIKFHRYADGARTAIEEHLADAARWLADGRGRCHLHFTVSPEHRARVVDLLQKVQPIYARRFGIEFAVDVSVQSPATDTIAVDVENRVVRGGDGALLFRPGGHGALLENLRVLDADVVFIENIDNVVPDHLKDEPVRWKQVLCGHLLALQETIFTQLTGLAAPSPSAALVEEARSFAERELAVVLPQRLISAGVGAQRDFLRQRLDRPLRVCGMVRNVGEPGGGPFWVRDAEGGLSRQIVESAQVDLRDDGQRTTFAAATHFNPVELACGLRDWRGNAFDLTRYVDPAAVFIARKSTGGREIKALERPGLWNGAMAAWNTVFVEIPNSNFNPVKTVNDLLRPEHQPE